jgi:hypothetical protein
MVERLTIESEPPRHYCHECAENVPEVIIALQLAYDQDLLVIWHDGRVTDEICAHCQRAIATIPAPSGLYEAEVTLTIQCRVTLTARSAPQAYYALRSVLDTQKFEGMLAEAEEALSNVRGIEEASAEDCFYDLEPATRTVGEDVEEYDAFS